ncbi:MAG: nucleoside triphosphate pyrophosphohydrolase, partial [Synergistaceae bacterium]|nr:nucleoside triphosphate pyrophosphohydrolase [Synergistaceae bacterium]
MSETGAETFDDLVRILKKLRSPGGCPWDAEQTLESLRRYII